MMSQDPEPTRPLFDAEQRRHLTILFTDLSDSTRLSGVMEAETYAEMLDEVRTAFRNAVAKLGGAINQFQGDGLQAVFGFPHANEYDGHCAAEAAPRPQRRVLRSRYAARRAESPPGIHWRGPRPRRRQRGRPRRFSGWARHCQAPERQADEILVARRRSGPAASSRDRRAPPWC
jgi:class 3 adenylate cyclase